MLLLPHLTTFITKIRNCIKTYYTTVTDYVQQNENVKRENSPFSQPGNNDRLTNMETRVFDISSWIRIALRSFLRKIVDAVFMET